VWTGHLTVNFNRLLTGEILKFQHVNTSNVASMWEMSITCERMVNKAEVKRPHGIDMADRKTVFIYLFLIHYINQRNVEKPIGSSISQYTYKSNMHGEMNQQIN